MCLNFYGNYTCSYQVDPWVQSATVSVLSEQCNLLTICFQLLYILLFIGLAVFLLKLDGVSPVDNRPSTNKLHHFVKKNKKNF